MKFIVCSKYIDRFICFSKEECSYYAEVFGLENSKFIFTPLGIDSVDGNISDDRSIFTAGRSNRDYDFLINALDGGNYILSIACDNYNNNDLPANVKILHNCFRQDMIKKLASCHCVIIPLKDATISSGQLMALQAMCLGKPVICTKFYGLSDYIQDGINGILIDNTKESLLSAISKLYTDKELYSMLSQNAKKSFEQQFTKEAMYYRISDIVYSK